MENIPKPERRIVEALRAGRPKKATKVYLRRMNTLADEMRRLLESGVKPVLLSRLLRNGTLQALVDKFGLRSAVNA